MPLRFLFLFTIHYSLFSKSLAQTFPEWSVVDSRKKEIAKLLADSVSGFSKDAVLLTRGQHTYFSSLQGIVLMDSLDSVSVQTIHNEVFAVVKRNAELKLINSRLQVLASGFVQIQYFDRAALVEDSGKRFRWVSLHQPFKNLKKLDSAKVFSGDVVLGRDRAGYYWLHPDLGTILVQIPKAVPFSSIKSALPIVSGKASYLAIIQNGMLRMFNQKGAAISAATKAWEMRPALTGIIFKNAGEWYYQDPMKLMPVPLEGKVISADDQKIIVNRKNKFFAFWKGGRATWLKLENADTVGRFNAGLASFRYKGKYGFIDSIGYIRIAARYQVASNFANGYSIVKAGSKWGVIDRRENFVVQPFNDTIWTAKGLFAQQSAQGVFLLDPATGSTSESFDIIMVGQAGFITTKSGKQGYLNTKAKTLLAPRYESIKEIPALNTVAYRLNGYWYFPEGSLGRIRSARKLSVCPFAGYLFIQPGNLN